MQEDSRKLKKRRAFFDYYRVRADIICIQETHSTKKVEHIWRNEWGGRIIFSHGTSKARGICLLFNRNTYLNITNISGDYEGRVICCEVSEGSYSDSITICAVYAPNSDSPAFFDAISQRLADYSENKVLLGDFNLVLDPTKDRHKSLANNWRAHAVLNNVMQEYLLCDVWRARNPDAAKFSWSRTNTKNIMSASRIDFALVSTGMDAQVENICYLQSILTDHSALYLSINLTRNSRGPGYWKLNSELLKSDSFCDKVREKIINVIKDTEQENKLEQWERFKTAITNFLKELSRRKACDEKVIIGQLCEKVAFYEDNMPLKQI